MLTDDLDRRSGRDRLNIAVLAPPWAPVTPESRDVNVPSACCVAAGRARSPRHSLRRTPDLIPVPVMHTMHWSIDDKIARLYAQYADHAHLVATTETQAAAIPPQVRLAGVVPNPVDMQNWPLPPNKRNYVVWTWRFEPLRVAQEVISAARAAQVPLVLSGPVSRGQERWFTAEIAPFLDADQVRYVGEVNDDRPTSSDEEGPAV